MTARRLALPAPGSIINIIAALTLAAAAAASPGCGGGGGGTDKRNKAPKIAPIPARTVQAGQRLSLAVVATDRGAAPILSGDIRGPLLTGGIPVPFDQLDEVEFDAATGQLELRVPPRETGPLEVRFRATDAKNPSLESEEVVAVTVTPPNLLDGIDMDGVFDAFEQTLVAVTGQQVVDTVDMQDLATQNPAGTINVRYTVATDERHVYLRVTWDDATEDRAFDLNVDPGPQNVDLLDIAFDHDGDGLWDPGEDKRVVFPYQTGSGWLDQSYDTGPSGSLDDPIVDGVARMEYDATAGAWTVELLIPRAPDSDGLDADLSVGAQVPFNIRFYDSIGPAAPASFGGGLFTLSGNDASTWADLPLPAVTGAAYAPVPTPTLGTFICISNHEDSSGELYELDLGTGNLVRLTTNTRHEDWVSVAPDGSFAAYGSSPTPNDFLGYEIYKWERSTGLETPLTSNALLDGHPGISPDNQRVVYVSFLPSSEEILIMDRDGGNVVQVTNNAQDENDPEWTKDGRIVIKSKQWTGNELMGVLNEDGTGLQQLTAHAFSDHDGMVSADNRWILYERFEASGPWAGDWNLTSSTPWTVRMVSTNGTEQRLLVDNPLVNWLPVMGPEGVVAYFQNTAFNGGQVRLCDEFGVDLGRLAPDHSHIRYMDWK